MKLDLMGVGPNQVMPLTLMLATVASLILIFWNKLVELLRCVMGLSRRASAEANVARARDNQPVQKL
jgi:undecaprenyl pyrophosphate phosphatase UppP